VEVRRATEAESEAIRLIYNAEVTASIVTFDLVPRTVDVQREWMGSHSGAYPVIVALDTAGTVAGFASLSPYRPRPGYSTTVEDSVYVATSHRAQGVGRLLLSSLVDMARAHGFHSVVGRIVGGQDASIALHRSCGFELVGVEREIGRKFGRWLDVAIMQRLL
jgi:L-amino acid N-acyltransferase YncA